MKVYRVVVLPFGAGRHALPQFILRLGVWVKCITQDNFAIAEAEVCLLSLYIT